MYIFQYIFSIIAFLAALVAHTHSLVFIDIPTCDPITAYDGSGSPSYYGKVQKAVEEAQAMVENAINIVTTRSTEPHHKALLLAFFNIREYGADSDQLLAGLTSVHNLMTGSVNKVIYCGDDFLRRDTLGRWVDPNAMIVIFSDGPDFQRCRDRPQMAGYCLGSRAFVICPQRLDREDNAVVGDAANQPRPPTENLDQWKTLSAVIVHELIHLGSSKLDGSGPRIVDHNVVDQGTGKVRGAYGYMMCVWLAHQSKLPSETDEDYVRNRVQKPLTNADSFTMFVLGVFFTKTDWRLGRAKPL